jgi:dTDP-glucose 4,6-dehydratase
MSPEPQPPPATAELLEGRQRLLITGGAGFIGGAMVRRLLAESTATVFNLDKMGYASDLTGVERLGSEAAERHHLLRVDLTDAAATAEAVRVADPDLVLHLAAESHVDRSIDGPSAFIESNVTGTFNLERSKVQRSSFETEILEQYGATVLIVHLHGMIFFGSASSVLEEIKAQQQTGCAIA